jgi:hypothetical protein
MNFLEIILNGVYQTIYIFSCIEIFVEKNITSFLNVKIVKKMTQGVSDFLQYHYPTQPPVQQYMFVEDGNSILVYKSLKDHLDMVKLIEPENYDFILRNDYRKDKKWINYKIIYDNVDEIGDYMVSSVCFLSFVIYYNNNLVDIQLDTKNYNYMIVGNKIGRKFIYYLLKNMGVNVGHFLDFNYTLQIITSDVNIIHLNSTQEIVIGERTVSVLDACLH